MRSGVMMKSKEREENDYEDGIDIFSVYKRKKTTFSESLEDDE
jgi:hypothetical protein